MGIIRGRFGAGQRQTAGFHAGGQHDRIEARQILSRGLRVQAHFDTGILQPQLEPVHQAQKLFFSRYLCRKPHLPAQVRRLFKQHDAVATFGGRCSASHARSTAAHHRNLARQGRSGFKLGLMASCGVDQTRGELAAERMIQTGLIAGDAGGHAVGTPGPRLGDKVRVGEQGPGQRHQIGLTLRQDLFGKLCRVDPVRRRDWHRNLSPEPLCQRHKSPSRDRGRNRRHPRLVPADARVEEVHVRLQRFGQGDRFGPGTAVRHQIDQ